LEFGAWNLEFVWTLLLDPPAGKWFLQVSVVQHFQTLNKNISSPTGYILKKTG